MSEPLAYDEWNQSPFEQFMERLGLHSSLESISVDYDFERKDPQWKASVGFDRCIWTGRGEDPEEALVEAWVDYCIGQWAYGAAFDAELTLEHANSIRVSVYERAGMEPVGEYRGEYHARRPASPLSEPEGGQS